jgi:hypothetical protein
MIQKMTTAAGLRSLPTGPQAGGTGAGGAGGGGTGDVSDIGSLPFPARFRVPGGAKISTNKARAFVRFAGGS